MSVGQVGQANGGALVVRNEEKIAKAVALADKILAFNANDPFAAYNCLGKTYADAKSSYRSYSQAIHPSVVEHHQGITPQELERCANAMVHLGAIWGPISKHKPLPTPSPIQRAVPPGTFAGEVLHGVMSTLNATIAAGRVVVQQKVDDGSVDRVLEAAASLANRAGQGWMKFMSTARAATAKTKAPSSPEATGSDSPQS